MDKNGFIKLLKRIWHFIWAEDSAASWIVNIILAFILIKFLIYPGLGMAFGTKFPIVAVVSGSMEHDQNFDSWWEYQKQFYSEKSITKDDFSAFPFRNGFNKGDLMVLFGTSPEKIKIGDVLVFKAGKPDPIIHRVIEKNLTGAGYMLQTKGDHNINQIVGPWLDETKVSQEQMLGKAVLRIPYLGWVKILFVQMLQALGIMR
jgi:signal peptidase I